MIVHLKGILETKTPTSIVIDVGGVGYEAMIPLSTYDSLPATGQECKVLTYHEVREDAQLLYAFMSEGERDMFVKLTSVSGVGPKIALSVLSGMTSGEIQFAIANGDSKRLATVKGIGKKTAERIVVELRDKVDPIEAVALGKSTAGDAARAGILRDAMLALTALGFADDMARRMVQKVLDEEPSLCSTEEILKKALKG